MDIDKAIATLQNPPTYENQFLSQTFLNALSLGIHALECLRYARLHPAYDYRLPLPEEN